MNEQIPNFNASRITRRDFLKFSALAAAALGSGYLLGIKTMPARASDLWMQAYLPQDEELVSELAREFWQLAGGAGNPQISAPQPWTGVLQAAVGRSQPAKGVSLARLEPLSQPLPADILLCSAGGSIHDPAFDFSAELSRIRAQVHGEPALLSLSLGSMAALQPSAGPFCAHIYDQRGLVERLALERDYRDIPLEGPAGRTRLRVESGRLWVQQASCRARLCQKSGPIALPGQRCVCAPNHLVIELLTG